MPKSAPAPEHSRDRVLSDEEIGIVWRAFGSVGWPFGAIGQLLLLTGARRDEVAAGTWNEINLETRTWTLPGSRTKNGEAHDIPLSHTAVEIFKALPRIAGNPGFIFTTNGKTPVSGFSKAKHAIGAATRDADADAMPHWTIHDLRRTVATNLQKLGVRLEVTEAILNHTSGSRAGVVGIYQRHTWADEKRAALDDWVRRLAEFIEAHDQTGNATWRTAS